MDDSQTVTSFVGSIIVFVPILYFPILVGATFNKHLDPNFISLSSAVGAVTKRIITFYARFPTIQSQIFETLDSPLVMSCHLLLN